MAQRVGERFLQPPQQVQLLLGREAQAVDPGGQLPDQFDAGSLKARADAVAEVGQQFAQVLCLGLEHVDGRAQVSMNLVDYTQSPLHTVMDRVTELAQAQGYTVAESELIGLIPQEVIVQAAAHYLKLPNFSAGRMVENAIAAKSKGS